MTEDDVIYQRFKNGFAYLDEHKWLVRGQGAYRQADGSFSIGGPYPDGLEPGRFFVPDTFSKGGFHGSSYLVDFEKRTLTLHTWMEDGRGRDYNDRYVDVPFEKLKLFWDEMLRRLTEVEVAVMKKEDEERVKQDERHRARSRIMDKL